jgi:glycosyltransferase involved in cell wall biosynthesis
LAHELGLSSEDVQFAGYTTDPSAYFHNSLFAVLPSLVEGMPIAVIEAAAAARATLVTDVDGARDTVPQNATLVNRIQLNEVTSLARALDSWFANHASTQHEGERFFSYHQARHSSEIVGNRYLELYRELSAHVHGS